MDVSAIYPTPVVSPQQVDTTSIVRAIIKSRKRDAFWGLVTLSIVFAGIGGYFVYLSSEKSMGYALAALGILALLVLPFLGVLYSVNAHNAETISPNYRSWNKMVYITLAKIAIFFAFLDALSALANILNPLYGFKKPSAQPQWRLFMEIEVDASIGASLYSQLKPADFIESYFASTSTQIQ